MKLLTVAVDRVRQWWTPGLLCIGDAAHAMSPIGGVGINLAVQDAVAAANILAGPFRDGIAAPNDLEAVQKRRSVSHPCYPRAASSLRCKNNVISRVLASEAPPSPPWPVRLLDRWPLLHRIPARLVGVGFRPEHICTPDVMAEARIGRRT